MKFLDRPKLYLISKPSIDRTEIARFLFDNGFPSRFATDHEHPAEQLSATASRTCYQSFDSGRSPDEHLKHLVEVGHGSVMCHANFSLLVTGISRSLSHELIRHHVGTGVSQLSQRFVDNPEELNFVIPPALLPYWQGDSEAMVRFIEGRKVDVEAYKYWLEFYKEKGLSKKQAAEAARAVLPNCVETRMVFSGNIRAWRNIWEQRCSEHAEAEIRRFACKSYELIYPHCPTICDDYTRTPLPDGTFELTTEHRKI